MPIKTLLSKELLLLLVTTLMLGCSSSDQNNGLRFELQPIDGPSTYGGEPNLFVSAQGTVYLSWVEFFNDSTDVLLYSTLENEQWSEPIEIARGTDWFVNWADFPSLAVHEDWMASHWLQKSAGGTYDYDVRVSTSTNGGKNWSPSFIPHTDGVAAEHGFVTMLPLQNKRIFATWLDGRNTKGEPSDQHGHGNKAMTLRCAEFDPSGQLFTEAELDNRVCDCCQTDACSTDQGPVVVYRDRSEEEVRDISVVRRINGQWSAPKVIHQDGWEIAGCPVNGPAISSHGNHLAVAWFTAPKGVAAVNVAFSSDAGASFSAPIRVDSGTPSGRVDIEMLNEKEALVIWLEDEGDTAGIKAAIVNQEGKLQDGVSLVETTNSRSSGFPILAKNKDQLLLAWTAVEGDSTSVQTALLN